MKTKLTVLMILSAIVTLSFTFVSRQDDAQELKQSIEKPVSDHAPIGGLASEETK